jgi:membrane complex biogenesis BtpA family protein
MVTDQGIVSGEARETLLARRRLGCTISIAADVLVKHAVALGPTSIERVAEDTLHRGRADVLIVTGTATGEPIDPADLDRVRGAVPEAVIWAGSGVTPATPTSILEAIDGAVVGTFLHADSDVKKPLDVERVKQLRRIFDTIERR